MEENMNLDELGLTESEKESARRKAEEKRVQEIVKDFEKRREARRSVESGWVLNEIEDSAGARMLYSCTDIDIIETFVSYIAYEMGVR